MGEFFFNKIRHVPPTVWFLYGLPLENHMDDVGIIDNGRKVPEDIHQPIYSSQFCLNTDYIIYIIY